MRTKKRLARCNRTSLVVIPTELDAKIILAGRIARDKGEIRYFPCLDHFHLTRQVKNASEGGH